MGARRSFVASVCSLSLVTAPFPSRSAQPTSVSAPVQPDPGANEEMPLDIDITSKRLDEARQQIQPSLGATKYQFDQQALEAIPQGSNADMNQVVLQSPGVWQDSFGQIHIRGEMANVQYRINGDRGRDRYPDQDRIHQPRLVVVDVWRQLELATTQLLGGWPQRTRGLVHHR
jgi:hypothetical protein